MLQLAAAAAGPFSRFSGFTSGKVVALRGPLILARIPQTAVGDLCTVQARNGSSIPAQVVSFSEDLVSLAPYDEITSLCPGAAVCSSGHRPRIKVSSGLIGKVLDALGRPLAGPAIERKTVFSQEAACCDVGIMQQAPAPLERKPINAILATGIRSIDALCTIGCGQRVVLLAEAGAGKSTLLGMIARNADVDVNVIALVGERGREVGDFIRDSLGQEGSEKSVVVAATSDETPLRRLTAAFSATAIAEFFRSQGRRVLLLVDSLTRVARAVRDVSLAAGELPVRQGYTPSVYTELPRLLERAGTSSEGSITAIYAVLTSSQPDEDPLAEEIKSLVDGHITLNSFIAQQGIRPAVDPLSSISRLMPRLHSFEHLETSRRIIRMLGRLRKDKEMLLFGAEPDRELRAAVEMEGTLNQLLSQAPDEKCPWQATLQRFSQLGREFEARAAAPGLSPIQSTGAE